MALCGFEGKWWHLGKTWQWQEHLKKDRASRAILYDHYRVVQCQIYWKEVLLNFCMSGFKEYPEEKRKKMADKNWIENNYLSSGLPVCFHFCSEERIRDWFWLIIKNRHPSWKLSTPFIEYWDTVAKWIDQVNRNNIGVRHQVTNRFTSERAWNKHVAVALCYTWEEIQQALLKLFIGSCLEQSGSDFSHLSRNPH